MSQHNEVLVHETGARGSGEKFGVFLFASLSYDLVRVMAGKER